MNPAVIVRAVATLPPEARELMESDALAHLVTLNRDGSPQVSCVWVGLDGDEIVCDRTQFRQKVRNVQRDPRVVVSVEATDKDEFGLRQDAPAGVPQDRTGSWVRRSDEHTPEELAGGGT